MVPGLYPRRVRPALILAVLVSLVASGPAHAQDYEIVVVPGLELADLEGADAAVGLLVPANGQTTSGEQARAALVRGAVENAFLGGLPGGEPVVSFREAGAVPADPGQAIVLGLPEGGSRPNNERYPIAVFGPGYDGLLTSGSTRIPGLVSVADVAPTALGDEDALGSRAAGDTAARLAALDERIDGHVSARLPAAVLAGLAALLWAFLIPRAGIVGFAVALGANLVAGAAEVGGAGAVLLLVLSTLVLTPLVTRALGSDLGVGLFCTAVLGGYLAALAADDSIVALSPWGPAQAGRFFGVTNLLETILLVPVLAGAVFLGRRLGPAAFVGVGLLALVTIAGGRFGADGGGAIVVGVGLAVAAVLASGRGLRWLAPALVAAAAVVVAFTWIDERTGAASHVTDAVGGGAGSVVDDLTRRLEISWEHATSAWTTAVLVVGCLLGLAALTVAVSRRRAPIEEKALPLAYAAALAASFLVNDSPTDVAGVGLGGFIVLGIGTLALDAAPFSPDRPAGGSGTGARPGGLRRRGDSRAPA